MNPIVDEVKNEIQSVIDALQSDERVSSAVSQLRIAIRAIDVDAFGDAIHHIGIALTRIDEVQIDTDKYEQESNTLSLIMSDIDEGLLD